MSIAGSPHERVASVILLRTPLHQREVPLLKTEPDIMPTTGWDVTWACFFLAPARVLAKLVSCE